MNEEINKKKESSNDQKSSKSAEPTVQNETKPAISGQKQQEKPSTTIKPSLPIVTEQKNQPQGTSISTQPSMSNVSTPFKFGGSGFSTTAGIGSTFPSIFGTSSANATSSTGFQFGSIGTISTSTTSTATTTAGDVNNSFRFGAPSTTTAANGFSGFQFGTTTSTPKPLFQTSVTSSFADLAKKTPTNNVESEKERVFPGQGTPVFGSTPKKSDNAPPADENDDTGGDPDESYEPSVTF
ncbi:unnamed protein product, partial [Didymodactylos carnosus]